MQPNESISGARIASQPSTVAGQAKEIAMAGSQQVKEIGQTTKERAFREIDSRRESIAKEVEKLAGTLETQRSESQSAGPVLDLAATAARRLSTALRENSAEALLQGATRNPVAVLAGTFALGFFVTRLCKA